MLLTGGGAGENASMTVAFRSGQRSSLVDAYDGRTAQ